MRLIDADEINLFTTTHGDLVREIDEAPTIDAVPVVRCKDCKNMMLAEGGMRFCMIWHGVNGLGDEGFCSYGVRKDGAEDGP